MHLFDSGGQIGVAARPVKTGHAIVGRDSSAKPGWAVRPADVMVNAQADAQRSVLQGEVGRSLWATEKPEISTGHHQRNRQALSPPN